MVKVDPPSTAPDFILIMVEAFATSLKEYEALKKVKSMTKKQIKKPSKKFTKIH